MTFAEPFAELGRTLDEAFRRAQYAESAFADLATEHLERARLHESFEFSALARWVLAARDIPPQEDIEADFGDPPVTLWNGRRFFVSALVWRSSTTSIHQHAFTGAFQVLTGSSVHARHEFAPARTVSEDLALGALRCIRVERLTAGATRPIPGSTHGIHSLFHLEQPSVSLVVRTHADHRFPIQYAYFPPGLAVWDQRREPAQRRARQMVRALVQLERASAAALIADALRGMPDFDAFWALEEARRSADLPFALRLLEQCRGQRDGVLLDAFAAALGECDRSEGLSRKREHITDPGLRYFLAILLNATNRGDALRLAESYAPGQDGAAALTGWLSQLAAVKLKLHAGGTAWEPNVFGLPDPDRESIDALQAMLAGKPVGPASTGPFLQAVRKNPAFAPLFRG